MDSQHDVMKMSDETVQIISFKVGDEEYGLEILKVKEVIKVTDITKLPKAPSFVKGVVNLRGDVIPIIDLREKFGLGKAEKSDANRVIVVEIDGKSVGMAVDSVSHVIRINENQIDNPPLVGGMSGDYIRGVVKLGDRLIVLINVEKILTSEEKIELGKIEQ